MSIRPEKIRALQEKFAALGIRESDLIERFIRSSGPGGQHTNKTATCVYLKHRPTGIEVKVQTDRSQVLNRFLARRALAEKFESRILGIKTAADKMAEKRRKQKSRRHRRAKKKIGGSELF